MRPEDNTELSTLMALARLLKGREQVNEERRHHVLDKLHSDWAKSMASAIMTDDSALSDDERKDLKIVLQLAGVEH
jgi:hypothetical protein